MVVGAGDGVVSYGGGVIIDIVGETIEHLPVAVSWDKSRHKVQEKREGADCCDFSERLLTCIIEATSSTNGGTFSKMRNFLAKSNKTEELCFKSSVFCEAVSVTCASSTTCSYGSSWETF
ncbi:hypothetical protein Tco_1383169 [Tanacetum coccineum]